MSSEATVDAVRDCMQTAFKLTDADRAAIASHATALDVAGWTSLGHVQLILELERAFDVEFGADEIASLASVQAILAALAERHIR